MSGWMISLIYGIFKNGTDKLIYITEQSHRCRKPSFGYQEGKEERDKLGDLDWYIHTTIYKIYTHTTISKIDN